MQIGRIKDATRTLGAPKDWDEANQGRCDGLPVRDEITTAGPGMTSAWFPTPSELQRLAEGAPIYLTVLGTTHPPVELTIGQPTTAELDVTPSPQDRLEQAQAILNREQVDFLGLMPTKAHINAWFNACLNSGCGAVVHHFGQVAVLALLRTWCARALAEAEAAEKPDDAAEERPA